MEKANFRVSGIGTIPGGSYNEVKVSGSAKAKEHIDCEVLRVTGACGFEKSVETKDLNISGACAFEENLRFEDAAISGYVSIENGLTGENIKITGICDVKGECNVEKMEYVGEKGEFENIYGESITISSRKSLTKFNVIEATNINLKNVSGYRVSGDDVTILGCSKIKIIEYKNTLTLSKNITVEEIIKL
ncbi:MAG: hypothetical protein SOU07_02420 [Bacilli bacterium]|nr:hypothetical protein [Acholeplasmataceae bacterium]MDY2902286.1 hypothetical protein [Bacilli bacterium]